MQLKNDIEMQESNVAEAFSELISSPLSKLKIFTKDGNVSIISRELAMFTSPLVNSMLDSIPCCSNSMIFIPEVSKASVDNVISIISRGKSRVGFTSMKHVREVQDTAMMLQIDLTNIEYVGHDTSKDANKCTVSSDDIQSPDLNKPLNILDINKVKTEPRNTDTVEEKLEHNSSPDTPPYSPQQSSPATPTYSPQQSSTDIVYNYTDHISQAKESLKIKSEEIEMFNNVFDHIRTDDLKARMEEDGSKRKYSNIEDSLDTNLNKKMFYDAQDKILANIPPHAAANVYNNETVKHDKEVTAGDIEDVVDSNDTILTLDSTSVDSNCTKKIENWQRKIRVPQACQLVIHGITKDIEETSLGRAFEKFGDITNVYNTGKGVAFITYSKREDAKAALKALDRTEVCGCYVEISIAKPRHKLKEFKVIVHNRNKDVTELDLWNAFSEFGPVTDVYISSKGYALVYLTSPEDARRAMEAFLYKKVRGTLIQCSMAEPRKSITDECLRQGHDKPTMNSNLLCGHCNFAARNNNGLNMHRRSKHYACLGIN